jgi:hypothetical protein
MSPFSMTIVFLGLGVYLNPEVGLGPKFPHGAAKMCALDTYTSMSSSAVGQYFGRMEKQIWPLFSSSK